MTSFRIYLLLALAFLVCFFWYLSEYSPNAKRNTVRSDMQTVWSIADRNRDPLSHKYPSALNLQQFAVEQVKTPINLILEPGRDTTDKPLSIGLWVHSDSTVIWVDAYDEDGHLMESISNIPEALILLKKTVKKNQ